MSNDQHSSGDAASPRRRPPPPTIDLTATEVPGSAGEDKDQQKMAGAERPAEGTQDRPETGAANAEAGPATSESAPTDGAPPDAGSVPPETPPPNDAGPQAPPPPREPGAFSSFARSIPWSALGGGIAGALIVLLLASGLRTMFVEHGESDIDERLARVESQLKDIAGRPAPTSVAPRALDDLAARVTRLEQTPAAPRRSDPAIDNRLSALEAATKSLADGTANLNRRADETAGALREMREQVDATSKLMPDLTRQASSQAAEINRADVDQLRQRIAALEAATASLKDAAGKAGEPERATRLAVLASALNNAVERGTPYATELAAVRAFVTDPKVLDPLQPFAASGVPSPAALARELAALAPKLPGATTGAPPAGFLDRLQANAERLVRVRPVNETQGDEPAAILARMQAKVTQGDVAGALADTAKLPADARAAVGDWSKKAAARQAAITAAQRLSAESFAALGRGANQGGQQK